MLTAATIIFGCATLAIILFQLAMALGAPWGHLAMGGAVTGAFPPRLRVAALAQALFLAALALVVFRHGGLVAGGPALSQPWLIWVVVAMSGIALVLNTITPSRAERRLWMPVAFVMFATSLIVAFSPEAAQ